MAAGGIMDALSSLFSGEGGIAKFLGSEMFSNLIQGGGALYQGMQAGDMMDFTQNLMSKQEGRTDKLFQDDQEQLAKNKANKFSLTDEQKEDIDLDFA